MLRLSGPSAWSAVASLCGRAFERRRAVHDTVGELINARNCYIALVSEDGQALEFPYYVDEQGGKGISRRMGPGLTEYVLRTRKPLLVSRAEADELIAQDVFHTLGPRATSWRAHRLTRQTSGPLSARAPR